jgi:uncharacterized protein YbcI
MPSDVYLPWSIETREKIRKYKNNELNGKGALLIRTRLKRNLLIQVEMKGNARETLVTLFQRHE